MAEHDVHSVGLEHFDEFVHNPGHALGFEGQPPPQPPVPPEIHQYFNVV